MESEKKPTLKYLPKDEICKSSPLNLCVIIKKDIYTEPTIYLMQLTILSSLNFTGLEHQIFSWNRFRPWNMAKVTESESGMNR